jgi:hypothetical protein
MKILILSLIQITCRSLTGPKTNIIYIRARQSARARDHWSGGKRISDCIFSNMLRSTTCIGTIGLTISALCWSAPARPMWRCIHDPETWRVHGKSACVQGELVLATVMLGDESMGFISVGHCNIECMNLWTWCIYGYLSYLSTSGLHVWIYHLWHHVFWSLSDLCWIN